MAKDFPKIAAQPEVAKCTDTDNDKDDGSPSLSLQTTKEVAGRTLDSPRQDLDNISIRDLETLAAPNKNKADAIYTTNPSTDKPCNSLEAKMTDGTEAIMMEPPNLTPPLTP